MLCVIAYHLNASWAQGGNLGVGVFFTLSGYLITDLLLAHWNRRGDLGLKQFWFRRARRLLPALFVMLALVSIWVAVFDGSQLTEVRRQVVSAALYFANWSTIAVHGSYFSRFSAALPLDHLWSLSIEEQFYLVWPWLLGAAIWVLRTRRRLALFALAGAAASALVTRGLYHPGYDPTRAYEGTDTRALGLLIGAALAAVWPIQVPRHTARRSLPDPRRLDVVGVAGLAGIFILVWRTNPFTAFLYPTGFVLLSIATAAAVAAVVHPSSTLGPMLGCRPLRWIGVRSYGIYLWQWPIIVLVGHRAHGVDWGKAALEVALTFAVAGLSWRYVEEPIRQWSPTRQRGRRRPRGRAGASPRRTLVLSGAALAAGSLAVVGLIGVLPVASAGVGATPKISGAIPKLSDPVTTPAPKRPPRSMPAGAPVPPVAPATRTSCRSVVYIGDSTSEGEISTAYIPNPRQRLPEQLARVGVTTTLPEISGARSIVETYRGQADGATVARDHVSAGFRGCWIVALGTNDVANVQVGSTVGLATRISRMMSIIGDQPVLWVDVSTLVSSGAYAESQMQQWNRDLLAACTRHPTMRVFDWSARAKRRWFIPDGIHYYSPGYVARSHLIARAMVTAFPRHRSPSAGCVVR